MWLQKSPSLQFHAKMKGIFFWKGYVNYTVSVQLAWLFGPIQALCRRARVCEAPNQNSNTFAHDMERTYFLKPWTMWSHFFLSWSLELDAVCIILFCPTRNYLVVWPLIFPWPSKVICIEFLGGRQCLARLSWNIHYLHSKKCSS